MKEKPYNVDLFGNQMGVKPARKARPKAVDTYNPLSPHSEAKVTLLGLYLRSYLNVLANVPTVSNIEIHDLFASQGAFDGGGEGSPLAILREIKALRDVRSGGPRIDCFFNDIDKDIVEKLKIAVKARSLNIISPGTIHYSSEDYDIKIRELLARSIPQYTQKTFVFIDPFGYKKVRCSDIRALLSKGGCEALVFLPADFMYRFRERGTPEALSEFFSDLTVKEDRRQARSVWEFIDQIKGYFREAVGRSNYVDIFTIQKDPSTVFCLVFFSSSILGFEKMLQAKWKMDAENGRGWSFKTSMFDRGLFFEENPLERHLVDYLRGGKRSNKEMYEFTLHSGYLPKHANEILSNLQKNSILMVTNSKGEKVKLGAFYLNYRYFKDEPNKVQFTLEENGAINN